MNGGGGFQRFEMRETPDGRRFRCPCCDGFTLKEPDSSSFEICPVCLWEIDDLQIRDPNFAGGANELSLREARAQRGLKL